MEFSRHVKLFAPRISAIVGPDLSAVALALAVSLTVKTATLKDMVVDVKRC